MGHLALEKLLKALVVKKTKAHAPFSHSLPYLAEKSKIKIPEKILIRLREFMEFHFEARYPDTNNAFYPGSRKPPASSGRMNAPTFGRDVAPLDR